MLLLLLRCLDPRSKNSKASGSSAAAPRKQKKTAEDVVVVGCKQQQQQWRSELRGCLGWGAVVTMPGTSLVPQVASLWASSAVVRNMFQVVVERASCSPVLLG